MIEPQNFQGTLAFRKTEVKEFISANFQVSDCYCDRDFMLTNCPHGIFPWFSLDITLKLIRRKIQNTLCDRVSQGKLGVQTSVNLSIFNSENNT